MTWIDNLKNSNIFDICERLGYQIGKQQSLGPCPECNSETRGKEDKRLPIGVFPNGSAFKCFVCGIKGDAVDLFTYKYHHKRCFDLSREENRQAWETAKILGFCTETVSPSKKIKPISNRKKQVPDLPKGNSDFSFKEGMVEECHERLYSSNGKETLDYLYGRGFVDASIKEFKLGCLFSKNRPYLLIPVFDKLGNPCNARFRSVQGKKIYLRAPGMPTTLFGVDRLKNKKKPVIITEGELDAIALWQYGFKENIVSGTAGAGHWKEEWLDILESYQHFAIAYDNDKAGNEGANELSKKLGLYRCSRFILPMSDAAECLENGVTKEEIISHYDERSSLLKVDILTVDKYAQEIEDMIKKPDTLRGRPTGSKKLDKAIGGIRDGLIIATGATGSGKTTFTTWLAWMQAYMGYGVLMTSFEQRPIGTVQKLLRQQVGYDFTAVSEEQRRKAMEQLGTLPIYILDHYGNMKFEELRDSIRFAIRRRNVRVAIVDHLGFITDSNAKDERREIERIVRELATIAVQDCVTIILICHPNRVWVGQQRRVRISDLKGASAIEQDAHVGIVVERCEGEKLKHPLTMIHVDKCRSEFGLMGSSISLAFDPNACVYADTWDDTPLGMRIAKQKRR